MCTHVRGVYPGPPTNPGAEGAWPATASELGQCTKLLLALGALLCGAALFAAGFFGAALSHGAMLTQLWGPMRQADRAGLGLWALGLHTRDLGRQLLQAGVLTAVLVPLWALALYGAAPWWRQWGILPATGFLGGAPKLVGLWGTAECVLSQGLGIALPEELFWRGYVQPVLQGAWSRRTGRPCGLFNGGTALSCGLFAVGHVVGGAGVASLATLFPSLLFAVMRNHSGSIAGPAALHLGCNVGAAAFMQTFDAL